MACRPHGSGSYTVVIIPLRTSLRSLDALRFYLQVKRLKDLEKEKDLLFCGLEIMEKARLWYLQSLEGNRARRNFILEAKRELGCSQAQSCLLRSLFQRVNDSLGSVMSEPNISHSSAPSLPETLVDGALRWHNAVLTQEVSVKNQKISTLELEKDALLEQLDDLQVQ
ncbi:suppressor APC domain-containing protein 1 isoform X2 [Takifugu rubripes]|uniref:suppressor APC domain-containing protein 1 isoform X2 n=1 Tax=Takifugu rubripes TaxID=31033 RepID=UPI001145B467|nr:suppressor APC domain-containing protein 1 isoform X2 [Takifugu rubripes]